MVIYQKNNLKIVSRLTKTETTLVMWLNIVIIVAQSVRLLRAYMHEGVHATRQCHGHCHAKHTDAASVYQVVHTRLTDSLLDDVPYLVVNRVELRTVWWPQMRSGGMKAVVASLRSHTVPDLPTFELLHGNAVTY